MLVLEKNPHRKVSFRFEPWQRRISYSKVEVDPHGKKVSDSVSKVVKQLVNDGHNLIINEVIWEKRNLENYALALIKNHEIFYVRVNCEFPLMEEKEALRGSRLLGIARTQMPKIKELSWNYDLQIDTTNTSSFTNVKKILQFVKKRK